MLKISKKINKFAKNSLCAVAMLGCFAMPQAALAGDISIYIDGKLLQTEVAPTIINGRTLLPLRSCGDALGAYVEYHEANKSIDMTKSDTHIALKIGSDNATINNMATFLDVPPMVLNDRTLVPLRFIGQAFNCDVIWDEATLTVNITTGADEIVPAEIPSSDELEYKLLNSINYIRGTKGLPKLKLDNQLKAMADAHSQDMATSNYFASNSPTFGTLTERAEKLNLPATGECLGFVVYPNESVENIISDWFNEPSTRGILLHPSAVFAGISTYQPENSNKVYAVVEVLNSPAYFTSPAMNSHVQQAKITVSGKTLNQKQDVTVYKLAANGVQYTSKKSFETKIINGEFTANITLWEKGEYLLQAGNATMNITF